MHRLMQRGLCWTFASTAIRKFIKVLRRRFKLAYCGALRSIILQSPGGIIELPCIIPGQSPLICQTGQPEGTTAPTILLCHATSPEVTESGRWHTQQTQQTAQTNRTRIWHMAITQFIYTAQISPPWNTMMNRLPGWLYLCLFSNWTEREAARHRTWLEVHSTVNTYHQGCTKKLQDLIANIRIMAPPPPRKVLIVSAMLLTYCHKVSPCPNSAWCWPKQG